MSARKYLPVDDIFTVGDAHDGAMNIPYHVKEPKQLNIVNKIKVACASPLVSDPFICMSADVFILKPLTTIPYWHKGLIVKSGLWNKYAERGTISLSQGCLFNFDNHAPWVVHKDKFMERFEGFEDGLIQTLYCKDEPGEYLPDCKIIKRLTEQQIIDTIKDRPRFSTYSAAVGKAMINVWEGLYES
jgi:hypothetical protein